MKNSVAINNSQGMIMSKFNRLYQAIKKYARKCRYCYLSMLTM
ncbi:hypothetical protein ACA086_10505 [Muriicola sp. E247]